MNLSEKNNLYLSQKKEIERLKNIVKFYEDKQYENIIVSSFLENHFEENVYKIEAKELYEEYLKFVPKTLGKRNFYKVAEIYGYPSKRGNENKLFVHGKS